jgi:hypothetical protein
LVAFGHEISSLRALKCLAGDVASQGTSNLLLDKNFNPYQAVNAATNCTLASLQE